LIPHASENSHVTGNAILGGTRVALGVGIGLLMGRRLNQSQREGAGFALVAVGALTTIPIVMNILGKRSDRDEPFLRAA
jgi:hypothetical protein